MKSLLTLISLPAATPRCRHEHGTHWLKLVVDWRDRGSSGIDLRQHANTAGYGTAVTNATAVAKLTTNFLPPAGPQAQGWTGKRKSEPLSVSG